MKYVTMSALVCILVMVLCVIRSIRGAPSPSGFDALRFLRAIREVEGWKPDRRGSNGEVGPYQVIPAVWFQHSRASLVVADQGTSECFRVAMLHLDWCRIQLRKLGYIETAYSLALIWNGGLTDFRRGSSERVKDYAERVSNIYSSYEN